MSIIFRRVFVPPKFSHWRTWILNATRCRKKAFEIIKNISLIQKKTNLPWLPKDVWNIIIGHVCLIDEIRPGLWKNNPVYWFRDWIEDQTQQQNVPIETFSQKQSQGGLNAVGLLIVSQKQSYRTFALNDVKSPVVTDFF